MHFSFVSLLTSFTCHPLVFTSHQNLSLTLFLFQLLVICHFCQLSFTSSPHCSTSHLRLNVFSSYRQYSQ